MLTGGTENRSGKPTVQRGDRFRRHFTYGRLEAASIIHSVIFAALMVSAFLLGKPEPATFVFGFLHGVLFIVMAVVCAFAGAYGVLPPKVVVAVIVFGSAGPFIGSLWFVRYADERPRAGGDVLPGKVVNAASSEYDPTQGDTSPGR